MTFPLIRWLSHPHEERADLAVIIVNWNVKEVLLENLKMLSESRGSISAECIVMDNASSDGSVEAVRQMFPQVHVIPNKENVGFARANQQGIEMMNARHCLLLNPDMRIATDALQKTVEYLDTHTDVGVVGAHLSTTSGQTFPSVRHFPDFWSQLAILFKMPHLFSHLLDRYLWTDFDYSREQSVDSVRGSYFAISRGALDKFGGLDCRYFLWFEEVDYCRQVVAAGWRVMYVPSIHATDLGSRSFKQTRLFLSQSRMMRSLIQYFQKWHPWWQAGVFQLLRPPLLLSAWITDRLLCLFKVKEYRRART